MTRFTYYAPLDPDCPDARAFHESVLAREDGRHLSCGPELVEDFERRHRAECERCHVYGAVNMEVRES
jgi:hypothetical protein